MLLALNIDSSGSCNLCVQGSPGAQAGCQEVAWAVWITSRGLEHVAPDG